MMFPFDYGFLPSTTGGDGDPLDIFLLGDTALPAGSVVLAEPTAVLLCEQTEKGKTKRNDRIIGLPVNAGDHQLMQPAINPDSPLLKSLGEFLVSYNALQRKKLRVIGIEGAKRAIATIQKAMDPSQHKKRAA
jgi:inorganic pyrophosphatase